MSFSFGIFLVKYLQWVGGEEVCLLEAAGQEENHMKSIFIIFAAVIITIIIIIIIIRKMITADINAIIFITGNFTVIINCVGIGLRTLFGPLPHQVVVIIIVIFTTTIPAPGQGTQKL